jgi:hypothetical protein
VSEEDHRKLDDCLPVLPDPFWQQELISQVRRRLWCTDPAWDPFQTGITAAQLENWLEQKGYASVEAERRELQLRVAISYYTKEAQRNLDHDAPGAAQGFRRVKAATGQDERGRKQRARRSRGPASSPSAAPGSPRVRATSLSSARATPTVPIARMRLSHALIMNLMIATLALALAVLSEHLMIPTPAIAALAAAAVVVACTIW